MGRTQRSAFAALIALGLAACAPLYTVDPELHEPRSEAEWTGLLGDIRSYQRTIGFEPTTNFLRADEATQSYTFCGHGSPLYLPYSYQDPAIRWTDARTEEECRAAAGDGDVTFGTTEAVAGLGTPVTRKMLVAPLPRFLYLALHDDCHEQFRLPYGIEEALCNMLAYAAMERMADARFGNDPEARESITAYTHAAVRRADFMVELYGNVASLYARHQGAQSGAETLLEERREIYRGAAQRLAQREEALNNIWLATSITYNRHFRLMQRVLEMFEGDLARTVAFFKRLDAAQVDPAALASELGCAGAASIDFVRSYETALVEVIERALAAGGALEDLRVQRLVAGTPGAGRCGQAAAESRLEKAPKIRAQKSPPRRDF